MMNNFAGSIKKLTKMMVLFILFAMLIIFSIIIPNFFTINNLRNILDSFVIYGVVSIAMTFAIICGEFDLSVGSTMALTSLVCANLIASQGMFIAMLAGILTGIVVGAFNGWIIAKCKVPAFVATLGSMIIVKGLALYFTDGRPVPIYDALSYEIGNGSFFGVSYLVIIFFALLIIAWFILKYTTFGRGVYAVGGSYQMAKDAGLNVDFYKFIVFLLTGISASVSGIMMACRIAAGNALYGSDLTMSAIAAVIVGGTSLNGGVGGVFRTLLGLALINVLFNAFTLLGMQAYIQQLIKGLIVIMIVVADSLLKLQKDKGD